MTAVSSTAADDRAPSRAGPSCRRRGTGRNRGRPPSRSPSRTEQEPAPEPRPRARAERHAPAVQPRRRLRRGPRAEADQPADDEPTPKLGDEGGRQARRAAGREAGRPASDEPAEHAEAAPRQPSTPRQEEQKPHKRRARPAELGAAAAHIRHRDRHRAGRRVGLRTYVVAPYYVPSASMEPTLHGCSSCNDDHVLVRSSPTTSTIRSAATSWCSTTPGQALGTGERTRC